MVYTTELVSIAVAMGTSTNDEHFLLKTVLDYCGCKGWLANPGKSRTQGSYGIKGKSQGESKSMKMLKVFYTLYSVILTANVLY